MEGADDGEMEIAKGYRVIPDTGREDFE